MTTGAARHVYRGVVVAFLVAVAVPFVARKSGDWEKVYTATAARLRAGLDVYEWNTTSYVYPPFGALVAVPFGLLPPWAGKVAWAAANALAGFVLLRGAWRLTGGVGLPGDPGAGRADAAAFWLGAAAAAGFILDVAANHQTDLLVAALVVYGCELLVRGRPVAAGALYGLAAALKCTPLLFAPYLLWKRQWRGAAAVVVVAVGANVLPDLAYPPADGQPRLAVWVRTLLAPITGKDFDPGMWASAPGFNHSLSGALNRWLTWDRVTGDGWSAAVPKADRPDTAALKRVVYGAQLGLLLFAAAAVWRPVVLVGRPPDATAAEFGMVLTLMLLLSPMSSKPHFCTLLLPQLLLARLAWDRRDRGLIALTLLAAALGLAANKDLVGRRVYDFLLWNGAVFGCCLALFLGCCRVRWEAGGSGRILTGGSRPGAYARVKLPAIRTRGTP
jgi:hypothetical protein